MFEHRDASDRLAFDFSHLDSGQYTKITNAVVGHFDLKPVGTILVGLDEIFQDYSSENLVVGLEWDSWSGYTVVAKNIESELIAKDIADFIKFNYN